MNKTALALSGLLSLAPAAAATAVGQEPTVPVGAAVVDVTPDYPVRLTGYGARTREADGAESRLKARALAVGDDGAVSVLIAVDNIGVTAAVTGEVADRLKAKAALPRERLVVASTHTHCGPALSGVLPVIFGGPIPADQQGRIDRYTRELTDALEKVALAAVADRKPGRLAWAKGSVGFAVNRRAIRDGKCVGIGINRSGPVDHGLPVLRATGEGGELRAVVAGYACHCTTLGPGFNKYCGDWAGYACEAIERDHPGAAALVVIGCGADANPEPRNTLDAAKSYGDAVAAEVARLLGTPFTPLPGKVAASFRTIDLPLAASPTRDEVEARAGRPGAEGYFGKVLREKLGRGETLPTTVPYPVQTWCFGDALAMVFLGGEVVVDYALRLRHETFGERLWPVAYCNDVPCYIASKRVLTEGGYEADLSMVYYGKPTRLAADAEDRIFDAVHAQLPTSFDPPAR